MVAALANNLAVLDFLVKRGVDVYATDDKGNTALMVAISFKATETTNYLLGIMSNEEIQSTKDIIIGLLKDDVDIINAIENFQTELNNNRKKLCTLLFSNKDGLPYHNKKLYPLMPTLNADLLPEMMEMIFDLKFLSLANQFPEWYKLSCLKQDIEFFLNWKPVSPQKSDNEVADDALTTVKNSFLSFFESIRNYIAPSEAQKRRREGNDDAGPENHKKPKL